LGALPLLALAMAGSDNTAARAAQSHILRFIGILLGRPERPQRV
jgi:hypothetical protein